ncbi:MAG: LruC domain-containing protein [Flavobacteriaceae bacterium]|nr:LruC domain-containing protein [Flavobacteriaceae bacterium]
MRFVISLIITVFFLSCTYDNKEPVASQDTTAGVFLDVPEDFDFSTHRQVTIEIWDSDPSIRYDIFNIPDAPEYKGIETFENQAGEVVTEEVYHNNVMERHISSGVPHNGVLKLTTTIPKYINNVYLRRKDRYVMTGETVPILNNKVIYNHQNNFNGNEQTNRTPGEILDFLFCVNGSGELFKVDPLNGDLTYLSAMPDGSYTAGIDQVNGYLYSIGRSSPNPIMKYSIVDNTWEIINYLGMGGPRLDYNKFDNLLYFSRSNKLYTIDPATGTVLDQWNIEGLHSLVGGDLVFAEDQTLFMCTFSGLYRLELDSNDVYQSTRISADNLPFNPTSMTFDSDQNLWLANNAASSDLIIMDTVTGGWQYTWGINAGNGTDFGRTINDLTTLRVVNENYVDLDTDGDGILDKDDAKPSDPEIAFETFTPSQFGEGTVAFEDLWPSFGDYDFNDVALNYRNIVYTNSQNLAVKMEFNCTIKSHISGYVNGVAFELDGLTPNQIESITNQHFFESYVTLNANGTEANQDNAVIFITDNAHQMPDDITVTVEFTTPLDPNTIGSAPFNPFIVANRNRDVEIHLPNKDVTSLGTVGLDISGVNRDPDGNYIASNGYPWAISLVHDFKVPKESVEITTAYNFFANWATSGGVESLDWYKDNPGNRNDEKLQD